MTGTGAILLLTLIPIFLLLIGGFSVFLGREYGEERRGVGFMGAGVVILIALMLGVTYADDEPVETGLHAVAIATVEGLDSKYVKVVYEDGSSASCHAGYMEYVQGDGVPVQTKTTRHPSLFGIALEDSTVYGLRVPVGCPAHVEKYSDGQRVGVATVFDALEEGGGKGEDDPSEPANADADASGEEENPTESAGFPERGL